MPKIAGPFDEAPELDAIDLQIIATLQAQGRISNAALSRQLEIGAPATLERRRKLEEEGVIRGYHARLEPRALDQGLLAFVFVTTEGLASSLRVAEALAAIPEVQEVHHLAGEDCLLLKVRAADTRALWCLYRNRLDGIDGVRSKRTTIVLETVKETLELPVPSPGGEASAARRRPPSAQQPVAKP